MSAHKTLAFVLGTRDYRDTSLLATFYTHDRGKIKAVVKGGRDGRARYGSTLEPFSLNEILLYQRKRGDLHLVTAAELIDRYDPLRTSLEHLATATYLLEVTDQLTESSDTGEDVFQLLKETLDFLKDAVDPFYPSRIFEAKIMDLMGFLSDPSKCIKCGQPAEAAFYFSIPSGGGLCGGCRKGSGPVLSLSPNEAVLFCQMVKEPFDVLKQRGPVTEVTEKIRQLLRQFVDYHLQYRPKSLTFMEKIKWMTQKNAAAAV